MMWIFRRRNPAHKGNPHITEDVSVPSSQDDYRPLEKTYEQCYVEAKWWFYVSIVSSIAATIITIGMVIIIVNFILLHGLTSATFTATLANVITSMINGVITYLVFSQKKYANERVDNYADKINKKVDEEGNDEKIRKLVEIVLDSHLSREDQSSLIKEIIERKALVTVVETEKNKSTI